MAEAEEIISALYFEEAFDISKLDHPVWDGVAPALLTRYWSGEEAPAERHAEARIIWTQENIMVRFMCRQAEPLIVSDNPHLDQKTLGLWERDVCEIFLAPTESVPECYFEFEAAPTGEWLDLAIRVRPDGHETDWDFRSRLRVAARVSEHSVTITMSVPFAALGGPARIGEIWRVNLFRCVGAGEGRGYLAWQPTYTAQPNFHVPQRFGWLRFSG